MKNMNKTRLFFISAAVAAVLSIGAAFLLLRSDDTLDEIDRVRRHPPASRNVDESEVARLVEVINEVRWHIPYNERSGRLSLRPQPCSCCDLAPQPDPLHRERPGLANEMTGP